MLFGGLLNLPSFMYRQVGNPELAATEQYNIVKYLYGTGPYMDYSGYGISPDLPDDCELLQVQMFMRHGERYPGIKVGESFEELVSRLQNSTKDSKEPIVGPLSFLDDYEYFVKNESLYEYETTPQDCDGPYTGYSTSRRAGEYMRAKYGDLYNELEPLPLFIAASARVYQTGKFFSQGFLAGTENPEDKAIFNVISENKTQGLNTLTPRWGCNTYNEELDHDEVDKMVNEFPSDFYQDIVDRLKDKNDGLQLNASDIPNMFQMCGYELNVRGYSPFCELFTQDEFVKNSYKNDLSFYYTSGPGNPNSKLAGYIALNATLRLLKDPPQDLPNNKIWLNFVHDTDLEIYHSALGLFDPIKNLSTSEIDFNNNNFHHIDLSPMGGRLITEKFVNKKDQQTYVRFIVNNSVKPLASCHNGPGFSCKLEDFLGYIDSRFNGIDINQACNVNTSNPLLVNFYWDYPDNPLYNITAPRVVA